MISRQLLSRKVFIALILAVALVAAPMTMQAASSDAIQSEETAAQYAQFLQEKLGVTLKGEVTKGDLISGVAQALDLKASEETEVTFSDLTADDALYDAAKALYEAGVLQGPAISGEQALVNYVAVSIAVRASDLAELAYTYPADKVAAVLENAGLLDINLAEHVAQELAMAIDTGIIPASYLDEFTLGGQTTDAFANVLLGKVLESKGLYKNYIGFVNDADIYAKFLHALDKSDIIDAPELQALVNEALELELITGYNIKDDRFDANFIESLSVTYGHSDAKHAVQLLGLLRSEGLNAKVQFQPKTSAFLHLMEWGDPGPNVVQIENGNFIAFSKEYDLKFEFANESDKAKFDQVIMTYAKKNEAEPVGLIHASWWQPLYFSLTETEGYEVITNNLIKDENSPYSIHPFSLNEDSEKVIEGFKSIDPDVNVTPYQFWVDVPFFNYLHGESL